MAGDPVMFDADAARRIAAATIRSELTPRRSSIRPAKNGSVYVPGLVRAKVTSAISSGSFDAPSSTGLAQIYHDGAASGDPVVVWNQFGGGSIAVGAGVLLGWIGGKWFVVAADC